jgi:predicted phosphodiesterase
MIFVTGDTHRKHDISKLNTKNFPEQRELTKDDYVIICGDFGCVWSGDKEDDYWLDWFNDKSFTTLFVDGNHENFDLLYLYDVVDFCGGKVRRVRDSVFHLMRGEVYTINNKKFFAMGGASSHDKQHRKEGVSWWAEELPSNEEYNNALQNLEKHNLKVDCIISHCKPYGIMESVNSFYGKDKLTEFFEDLRVECTYTKWFFGHYHQDVKIDKKHTCLYNKIERIDL